MTASQLIKLLSRVNPETEIVVESADFGAGCNTVAPVELCDTKLAVTGENGLEAAKPAEDKPAVYRNGLEVFVISSSYKC